MIYLSFLLKNPFHRKNDFRSLFERGGRLFGNKNWEAQLVRYTYNALELEFNTNFTGSDHAGPSLSIGLLGFTASVKIYDGRHWDHKSNAWERYD